MSSIEYIQTAADCNIKRFMKSAFDKKYSVLVISGEPSEDELKNAVELIYSEYADISGLYQTREFELSAYINSLDNRVTTVNRFVELQRLFLAEFGLPFIPGLGLVKKYGHKLYWDKENPDPIGFLKRLSQIEVGEQRYKEEINRKVKELVEFRRKKNNKTFTLLETRKEFITMLNRLQQARFVIDKEETTMEELALMIKDNREQVEAYNAANRFKKR